jgi:hypothetical protein
VKVSVNCGGIPRIHGDQALPTLGDSIICKLDVVCSTHIARVNGTLDNVENGPENPTFVLDMGVPHLNHIFEYHPERTKTRDNFQRGKNQPVTGIQLRPFPLANVIEKCALPALRHALAWGSAGNEK